METSYTQQGWNTDNSYSRLPEILFTRLAPVPVQNPGIVVINEPLAISLGLDPDYLKSEEGIRILAGSQVIKDFNPIAQAYAGHQFGYFTMLGDGRAILLCEQITPNKKRYDIQLKGSGKTPYSRGGDGRAALGPMLREYLISESMHALGIPTTRSLAVITTGEPVFRETVLPGAILTRVAESHIRVGTFQFALVWGTTDDLRTLADYTIKRHFPDIDEANGAENKYLSLLNEVIRRQAFLIAEWQLTGFIHGVMNTDNMTISGETIDYGPCAFMDNYDPKTVFSSIDTFGRYAYSNQPIIAKWNLGRFAESLLPLISKNEKQAVKLSNEALSQFDEIYNNYWMVGMREKLGLFNEDKTDKALIDDLLSIMHKYNADYTNTFRALTLGRFEDTAFFDSGEFFTWHHRWKERLRLQQESEDESRQLMKKSNPSVIPRNHRVEEALEAAVRENDFSVMKQLLNVLSSPYSYDAEQDEFSTPPKANFYPYRTFCGT
ncbi:MAG TPA: YdiU family protein [Clostridiales bacterium]|nr:YdiU family protein [Clostridiales bacterium]